MDAVARTDIAELDKAIYDESIRTLTEQARLLEGLRSRASVLAAVANVTTAFFGGLALADGSRLGALEWAAIGLFVASLAASLAILTPSTAFVFWHHPHDLIRGYLSPGRPTTISFFRRSMAYRIGRYYDRNDTRLKALRLLLSAGTMLLTMEVVLWLIALAR